MNPEISDSWSFKFSENISFQEWRKRLGATLSTLFHEFSPTAREYLSNLINRESNLLLFAVRNTIVYTYTWGNGETKSLIDPLLTLSLENQYWAEKYPFISKSGSFSGLSNESEIISFQTLQHLRADLNLPNLEIPFNHYGVLISHVNHFGHYILDDLPLHCWLLSLLRGSHLIGIDTGLSPSIVHEFNELSRSIPNNLLCADTISSQSGAYRLPNAYTTCTSNPLVSLFLLRKMRHIYLHKPRDWLDSKREKQLLQPPFRLHTRLFVTRGSHAASRIFNYREVVTLLIDRGFFPIDITKYSIQEIANIFSYAELIASECGTASHLSAYLSGDSTKIIGFVPERLFKLEDYSSLYGCLSYYCGYLDKVRFISGQTIEYGASPTSDKVIYKSESISQALDDINT